jgi:hypothetical protein
MKHGKHVLVEKPLALTLEECDQVVANDEAHDGVGGPRLVAPRISGAPRITTYGRTASWWVESSPSMPSGRPAALCGGDHAGRSRKP